MFLGRGALHVVAVVLWFYAMARVPVAEMAAIAFLGPVMVLVIGGLILGEGLGARRIAAVLVAVAGGLIVLRPRWSVQMLELIFLLQEQQHIHGLRQQD